MSLFTVLPIYAATGVAQIQSHEVKALDKKDDMLLGLWNFGSATPLEATNNKALVMNARDTTNVTYNEDGSLSLKSIVYKGVDTTLFNHAFTEGYTLFGVFKIGALEGTTVRMLFGDQLGVGLGAVGASLFVGGGNNFYTGIGGASSSTAGGVLAEDTWYFGALVIRDPKKATTANGYIKAANTDFKITQSTNRTLGTSRIQPIGIGQGSYVSSTVGTNLTYAEFGIYSKALTDDEITEVFLEAVARHPTKLA